MVTTKGTGLNPNAKVWQEIPTHQSNIPEETEDSPWLLTDSPPAEMTGGYSDIPALGGKGYDIEYPDSTADFAHGATEAVMNSTDHPDLSYLVFDTQGEPAVDGDVNEEQPLSQESLRESLKKQLESCFSRENLTKDLYLISQMDSDQFVPIWTIASMEDIKALTTDMELIVDVLRGSPLVQVDESGEKVRPNHSRSIIILREVPETTPVEEVEALFKSENCPKVLSVEFAHNSNWYITFQSDMDALQAYRYLREEVKMFQGKPIMARIKAINTFFGKNGFRSVDLSAFSQHTQPQAQYSSPVYMQQVYSPQQYSPVYPVVSPSWSPPVVPYFETPLAPFPHSGFVNGFNSSGNYKANSSTINTQRPQSRNRNHIKGPHRPADIPSLCSSALGSLMDSKSQTPQTSGVPAVPLLSFGPRETPPQATIPAGYMSGAGRGRRGIQRGMRRRREDEQSMKPVPLMEAKVPPPPQFDLAASNFPPLPGSVVGVREETTLEMRLSDVVRGLKVTSKSSSQEVNETRKTDVTKDDVSNANSESTSAAVTLHTEITQSNPRSPLIQEKEEKDEPPVPERKLSTSSEHALSSCSQPLSPEVPSPSPPSPTSEQGLRKLSYAEVCQRPAKDLPPVQTPSPPPPAPSSSQPLQELKVNRVEELRPSSRHTSDKPVKSGHGRPPRQPLRSFAGTNRQSRAGGAGQKIRQHQRGLNTGKQFSPQRGTRRSGKEQNIPPRSPK